MADALAIISRAEFEKIAGKDPKLGVAHTISRYDSTHKALDTLASGGALYLVTVRPGDELWLVGAMRVLEKTKTGWTAVSNRAATADLTAVKHLLEVTANAPPGKLAMSLQTPRVLSPHDARLLTHVESESADKASRKKPYTVKFPKWLLEHAAEQGSPPKPEKAARSAKPAKPRGKTSLSEILVEGALAQLEEVLGDGKPEKLLAEPKRTKGLRGAFTQTVQSVFGGPEPDEARRLLREELAPFVDGPALALALATIGDDVHGDLVDQFAIRAIDDLARALLALALDRPDDVPATCAPYRDELAERADSVKALLG